MIRSVQLWVRIGGKNTLDCNFGERHQVVFIERTDVEVGVACLLDIHIASEGDFLERVALSLFALSFGAIVQTLQVLHECRIRRSKDNML